MDLSKLSFEDFSSRIGERFLIAQDDEDPIALELTAADVQGSAGSQGHPDSAFSIIFRGPLTHPLQQQIHELQHPAMGTLPLFIVPVRQDRDGFYYEAVFTRLEQR